MTHIPIHFLCNRRLSSKRILVSHKDGPKAAAVLLEAIEQMVLYQYKGMNVATG